MEDPDTLDQEDLDRLTDYHPLFRPAMDYLARHKLGLVREGWRLPATLQDAILMVDQEIARQTRDRADAERTEQAARRGMRRKLGAGDGGDR